MEENIVLAAELRAGLARDAARSEAWQLARMLGIEDVLHRRPGRLSGGQLQRAAIAVALELEYYCSTSLLATWTDPLPNSCGMN